MRKQKRNQRREGEEGIVKIDLYKRAINKLNLKKINFYIYYIMNNNSDASNAVNSIKMLRRRNPV